MAEPYAQLPFSNAAYNTEIKITWVYQKKAPHPHAVLYDYGVEKGKYATVEAVPDFLARSEFKDTVPWEEVG